MGDGHAMFGEPIEDYKVITCNCDHFYCTREVEAEDAKDAPPYYQKPVSCGPLQSKFYNYQPNKQEPRWHPPLPKKCRRRRELGWHCTGTPKLLNLLSLTSALYYNLAF